MSSGQWEVVGKNKKSQNGKVKQTAKDDDKKPTRNGPKLEDVVPHSQIKSYYSGMEIDDPRPTTAKKAGKNKKQEKKSEPPKPKPPKTIEGAFEAIDPVELANIIATNKVRFSNAPLVWLKEVASFLNSKTQIEVDDPTFAAHDPLYPLSVLPAETKRTLENLLTDAGKANAQLFFDVTLTALANDMSRGQLVNGHRLLLQMLAQDYPEFCVASLPKSASLRNSYQNRPPIGLSLLWAFGQGGLSDFSVGLKAWQELFLPIIELKNYSKYSVGYLSRLLDRHAKMDATKVSQEQLLAMFDMVNAKKGLSKELSSDLMKQLSKYKDIYFNKSAAKLQVTFNQLIKKLPNQYLSGPTLDPYNRVLVESLVDCLQRDDSCNATWRQLFQRCPKQSATLLDYIDSNWTEISPKLKLKSFKTTVTQYKEIGVEALKGKKKDETVVKTNKICQDILDRMRSSGRSYWLWISVILLLALVGMVTFDIANAKGNFRKSATGQFLNDVGVLEPSQKALQKSLSASARGYVWLETNTPIYYAQAVEIAKPYTQLSKDFVIIGIKKAGVLYENVREYAIAKAPVVAATIEHYAPGFLETVKGYAVTGYEVVSKYAVDYYQFTSEYLKTKVFVGEWAPEILQNKTQSALNVTRFHVSSYYHWFREQVNVYSEIP